MYRKKINFIFILLLLFLLPFFSFSEVAAQGTQPLWEYAIDQCELVDHYWEPSNYSKIDPNTPTYMGSLSLGGLGFTFNLEYIEPGSTWLVNFNDQFQLESTVDPEGKALVYYGLWSYGDYFYTSTFLSPSSETMHGPSGTITIGDPEYLDCSYHNLLAYQYPPTVTPETIAATSTSAPAPVLISEDPLDSINNNLDMDSIDNEISLFSSFFDYILSSWYLLFCCVILVVLILFGLVVIVIRRTRPDTYERIRTRFKF